jgi:hypothetical protein
MDSYQCANSSRQGAITTLFGASCAESSITLFNRKKETTLMATLNTLAEHQKAATIVKGHHSWEVRDGKHQYVPVTWAKEEHEFPKVRYHAIKDAKTVRNEQEEEKLTPTSEGWINHPVTAQEDDWKGQLTRQTGQIVTPAHVDFCRDQGYGVQNVTELQTLLNDPTKVSAKARQSFFAAADLWIKKNAVSNQQSGQRKSA